MKPSKRRSYEHPLPFQKITRALRPYQSNDHEAPVAPSAQQYLLYLPLLFAQAPTQTVRGQLIDAETQQPLAGANVQLLALGQGAVTDSLGRFRR